MLYNKLIHNIKMEGINLKNPETYKDLKKTYQKPTMIYKFIGVRRRSTPFLLLRTLGYMRGLQGRKTTKRERSIDAIAKNLFNAKQGKPKQKRKRKPTEMPTSGDVLFYIRWHFMDDKCRTQKTSSYSYICPWCRDDYKNFETYMIHLKNWHLRMKFEFTEVEKNIPIIDMKINTNYDASYVGYKYPGHDLKHDFKFSDGLPRKREPQTHVIFYRSRKKLDIEGHSSPRNILTVDDDDEVDVDVCSGRLYYHTSTCLPIKPNELDIDSEADMDPEWLQERTQLMIDEFTDVNEGEKEIFKMWNLHIMRNYKVKSDSMIRQACLDFIEWEGGTMLAKNLSKNLTLHLVNLHEFGLISSADVLECIRKFRKMKPPHSSNKMKIDRRNQHSPPAKRASLNSIGNELPT